MRSFWIKLIFFVAVWYELSAELRIDSGRAFALALLAFGLGMSLLQLPAQLMAMLGPWIAQLLAPAAI